MLVDKKEIESIIGLLDDEDPQVFALLKQQLMGYGNEVLPILDEAIDTSISSIKLSHLQEIFSELNLENACSELRKWKNSPAHNLFQAMAIIARFRYPKLDLDQFNAHISKIRQDLWLEVNDNLTALEKIRVMNRVFFDLHGFRGNTEAIAAPENSYLNDVLSKKKGNPISLSILYSMLAQSVNIPVYGVNMPRQFMLAYIERIISEPNDKMKTTDVLFYINPFNKGEIYSANEVRLFLSQLRIKADDELLLPCPHTVIIRRCLFNLINAYKAEGNLQMVDNFEAMRAILEV